MSEVNARRVENLPEIYPQAKNILFRFGHIALLLRLQSQCFELFNF